MHSGVASTVPCPKESSASASWFSGRRMLPHVLAPALSSDTPKPNALAWSTSVSPFSRSIVSLTNEVLHDRANAWRSVIVPWSSFW
ncbi:hypothetical protein GCM10027612_74850 [Microbispora bryophytorum subsp. camponoti]